MLQGLSHGRHLVEHGCVRRTEPHCSARTSQHAEWLYQQPSSPDPAWVLLAFVVMHPCLYNIVGCSIAGSFTVCAVCSSGSFLWAIACNFPSSHVNDCCELVELVQSGKACKHCYCLCLLA